MVAGGLLSSARYSPFWDDVAHFRTGRNRCPNRPANPPPIHPRPRSRTPGMTMPKETWIAAIVLTIIVIVGLVMLTSGQHNEELERGKAELAEARATMAKGQAEIESL